MRENAAKSILLLLGLAVLGSGTAHAFGKGDQGTSGAQFLKLEPGARPAAMGGAFSAVADDVHAVYYNPAGLGRLKSVEIAGMHNSHFQGISHNFGAVAVPILSWVDTRFARNEYGVMAFSLTSLSVSGIERRGVIETDQPTGNFGASDFAYTLAYGKELSGEFSAGAAVKFIDQTIDDARSTALGLDLGLLYRLDRWSLAAGLRNYGTKVKFRSESDPLPMTATLGASYRFSERFLGAADIRVPRDNSIKLALGGEYRRRFHEDLIGFARGGYDTANAEADGFGGVTLGAGLRFRATEFDFAWIPFGDLGSTFRYSLLIRFE